MGVQIGYIGAAMLCAMIAAPYCYNHRMDRAVLFGTLWAFTVIPLIVGVFSKQAYRSVTLAALALLLLCPVVYAITDPLAKEFEQVRDGYFLAASSSMVLVSSAWMASSYRSGNWLRCLAAIFGGISSSLAVFVLLWMIMYFE
jgi:hypothetical protein